MPVATLFPSNAAWSASETPWDSERIANLILYQSARIKDALPMIKLARFGTVRTNHGCLRSDENLLDVTGLEGDYDAGECGAEWAASELRRFGIEALVYTTASHTDTRPRWRVLAPFSEGREPAIRDGMVSRLNGVLEGVLAPESWDLSRSYYYGSVRGQPLSEVIRVEGTRIDLVEGLPEVDSVRVVGERFVDGPDAGPKTLCFGRRESIEVDPALRDACLRKVSRTLRNGVELVANAKKGSREITLHRAAYTIGGYLWSGLVDEAAVYRGLEFAAANCGIVGERGVAWTRDKIARGLERGANNPLSLDRVKPYAHFGAVREGGSLKEVLGR